ncbi:hypothetical protein K435DRAFT_850952 [Dendrothele bispora CBS 962.96]|uniref:Uncharacterized protein n=1 Tax=Dendrothele bispora (strain CBS 962.96) TaxID=1314807 RepID=A0A4S8MNJ3_DENBC|nr:hypothetical protein K435DRAFT_850952 [Dendrothele bispora CBS 962.96]
MTDNTLNSERKRALSAFWTWPLGRWLRQRKASDSTVSTSSKADTRTSKADTRTSEADTRTSKADALALGVHVSTSTI